MYVGRSVAIELDVYMRFCARIRAFGGGWKLEDKWMKCVSKDVYIILPLMCHSSKGVALFI